MRKVVKINGGADGDRTHDLRLAKPNRGIGNKRLALILLVLRGLAGSGNIPVFGNSVLFVF